jgi:hypothetical protein
MAVSPMMMMMRRMIFLILTKRSKAYEITILSEPHFMKLGINIMAHELISFINDCHPSVCLYGYPSMVARQRLSTNSVDRRMGRPLGWSGRRREKKILDPTRPNSDPRSSSP